MKARKDTIKQALQTAKLAKYPPISKNPQTLEEWETQQAAIIKTIKGLLK